MQQYEEIPLLEGALQKKAGTTSTLQEPNLASTEKAVPEGDIGLQAKSNATTRPHQNVETYKQGPTNIQKFLLMVNLTISVSPQN